MLKEKDYELIKDYIINYGFSDYSKAKNFIENGPNLDCWKQAKSEYLFGLFSKELILEKEISVVPSEAQLTREYITKFKTPTINNFYAVLYENLYSLVDLYYLSILLKPQTLIKNRWEESPFIIKLPNDKNLQVKTGMRITRILQTLSRAFNIPNWEVLRRTQAEVNSISKVKGTLCLSIHPMDYLTMSDNEEGWDSCMSWVNKGGYRAGTIEMLNSSCVIVAYIKNPNKNFFEDWNSKIWRELYIVTPQIITNIKAYPFENREITKTVLHWLKELADKANFGNYSNKLYDLSDTCVSFTTYLMYNDCERGLQFCYCDKNVLKENRSNRLPIRIEYSGENTCIACGAYSISESDKVVCEVCEPIPEFCENCGIEFDEDDEHLYTENGERICPYCYNDLLEEKI